jgi:hypothetical protein
MKLVPGNQNAIFPRQMVLAGSHDVVRKKATVVDLHPKRYEVQPEEEKVLPWIEF